MITQIQIQVMTKRDDIPFDEHKMLNTANYGKTTYFINALTPEQVNEVMEDPRSIGDRLLDLINNLNDL